MTAPLHRSEDSARARLDGPRRIRAHERTRLLEFLDDGLRRGERGRLEAEYPVSLQPRDLRGHRVVFAGRRPVAHAMLHALEVCARGSRLRVGLIGGVYTAPEWRGRGLAQRCLAACIAEGEARELPILMLWSELHAFYARLGFAPAGDERRIALSRAALERACSAERAQAAPPHGGGGALAIAAAQASDFNVLEALYAEKPVHVARGSGALARLARAPEVRLRVARRRGAPIAYAACGRGDDMRGVVHEWAGEAEGVLACVAELQRDCGARLLLASPEPEPAVDHLLAAGALSTATPLALVRIADPQAFARATGASSVTAWPLYVWGFDSI